MERSGGSRIVGVFVVVSGIFFFFVCVFFPIAGGEGRWGGVGFIGYSSFTWGRREYADMFRWRWWWRGWWMSTGFFCEVAPMIRSF